jgi:hypothetical protein
LTISHVLDALKLNHLINYHLQSFDKIWQLLINRNNILIPPSPFFYPSDLLPYLVILSNIHFSFFNNFLKSYQTWHPFIHHRYFKLLSSFPTVFFIQFFLLRSLQTISYALLMSYQILDHQSDLFFNKKFRYFTF